MSKFSENWDFNPLRYRFTQAALGYANTALFALTSTIALSQGFGVPYFQSAMITATSTLVLGVGKTIYDLIENKRKPKKQKHPFTLAFGETIYPDTEKPSYVPFAIRMSEKQKLLAQCDTAFFDKDTTKTALAEHLQLMKSTKMHTLYGNIYDVLKKAGIDYPVSLQVEFDEKPETNAYAYTSNTSKGKVGTIGIHSGLLKCANQDELQGVIAHEVGHLKTDYNADWLQFRQFLLVPYLMGTAGILCMSNLFAGPSVLAGCLAGALVFSQLLENSIVERRADYNSSGLHPTEGIAKFFKKYAEEKHPNPLARFAVNTFDTLFGDRPSVTTRAQLTKENVAKSLEFHEKHGLQAPPP